MPSTAIFLLISYNVQDCQTDHFRQLFKFQRNLSVGIMGFPSWHFKSANHLYTVNDSQLITILL